jgi:uncharacterized phage protein (TIGR01671 family)
MRPIIFRAKATHGNEWVYGNFIHSSRFAGCGNEFRIHNIETGLESDVDPETVGQFTGLKDKNGIDIYEADVFFEEVECDEGDERLYTVVVWLPTKSCFALLNKGEFIEWENNGDVCLDKSWFYEIDQDDILKMHRAGNVYDNPILLIQ